MCINLNAYAKCQSTDREIKTTKCLFSNEIAKVSSAKFSRAMVYYPTARRGGKPYCKEGREALNDLKLVYT